VEEVGDDLVYRACREPTGRGQTETGVAYGEDGGRRSEAASLTRASPTALLVDSVGTAVA